MGTQLVKDGAFGVLEILEQSFLHPVHDIFPATGLLIFPEGDPGFFDILSAIFVLAKGFGQQLDKGLFRDHMPVFFFKYRV